MIIAEKSATAALFLKNGYLYSIAINFHISLENYHYVLLNYTFALHVNIFSISICVLLISLFLIVK